MHLHLTIKAKLVITTDAAKELKSTMEEFNRACNTISELSFQQDLRRKYDIHHAAYHLIREETNLPAQHVINAIAKVSAAYVRTPDKLHRFKPYSSVRYYGRTMVLGQDCYTAALTICPKGRVTGQLQMSGKMRKRLCDGELGSAELVYRKGQFYLHISITVPAPEIAEPRGSLGVDLGVNRVAVTSDKKFHSAKKIRHQKACYKRTRKHLQANGSKSAKRALKRVSGREKRFVSDTNHCISKQIVAEAKAHNQRIVLGDLTGIRESGKAKVVHDWSFAELQGMISYKAKQGGVEGVFVEPRYTSRMCSRCLHMGVRPDQSNFHCRNCGLQLKADLNGARSIALRHDLPAMGRLLRRISAEESQPAGSGPFSEKSAQARLGTASPHYCESSCLVAGS
jgi:putative transposase